MTVEHAEPWLIVIDMQEAFADPSSEWAVEGYAEVEKTITELMTWFPARVVCTRFVPDPEETGSWKDYYDRWSTMRQPPSSPRWDLTIPAQDAPVVSLPTFSKWGPDLTTEIGRESPVVLCGVATDCCVLATALGAVDTGRPVTIVKDACAGVSRHHHEQALSLLELLDPMVTTTTASEIVKRALAVNTDPEAPRLDGEPIQPPVSSGRANRLPPVPGLHEPAGGGTGPG